MIDSGIVVAVVFALLVIVVLVKGAVVVPQQRAFVVERLGRYDRTLEAGFHVIIPFFDRIAYAFSLKEEVLDAPPQACITKDNVAVSVDGLLYIQVVDPKQAAYGISNYALAASQLAQTTLRSVVGKIELDKTFEEREAINADVVASIDEAAQSWGVKVLRYEIRDITPPESVRAAMEAQMSAEREKRAAIARSEGEKQATINRASAQQQESILTSQGERDAVVFAAEGRAKEIELVARATAEGIRIVAESLAVPGADAALNLRLAEQYIGAIAATARKGTTLVLPQNYADVAGLVGTAMRMVKTEKG